jgi:phosphoenolpyruvate synthase/pyruvate phosphate dikinase
VTRKPEKRREKVILVRIETSPEDLKGMKRRRGVLTQAAA